MIAVRYTYLRPEEARDATAVVSLMVRRILDWLEKNAPRHDLYLKVTLDFLKKAMKSLAKLRSRAKRALSHMRGPHGTGVRSAFPANSVIKVWHL
jgi:hypothetical protein